jgi:hypothetical protein
VIGSQELPMTTTKKTVGASQRASRRVRSAPAAPVPLADRYTVQIRYRTASAGPPAAGAAAPAPATAAAPAPLQVLALTVDDRSFYPEVQRWRYVVANRRRITRATRETLADDVARWLAGQSSQALDIVERHLRAMAGARLVEVLMPFEREDQGWAARLFPWETTLALATRPSRNETEPFTVVRCLQPRDKRPLPPATPVSLLVVRSGPGEIGTHYALERECELVASTLAPQLSRPPERLIDPDRSLLHQSIQRLAPSIVHLAGVDPYALQTLNLQAVEPDNTDGFVLRKAERGFDSVSPQQMAPLLTAGQPAPLLVAASSCFSAPRLCALAVAAGARYAIGFYDTLTDADAVLFFGQFYRDWCQGWDIVPAFDNARATWLAQQPTAQASGVVLWSRHSLLVPEPSVGAGKLPPTLLTEERDATVADLKLAVELHKDMGPTGVPVNRTSLNYSLLHNDRSPFKTFYVDKPLKGRLPPLLVDVVLEVGNDSCRCRFAQDLPEGKAGIELAPRIRLPLVAGLLRQCTESLRTNLYVNVRCGERLLLEASERVTVLPADEWRDDGEDHRWLPSFVLPRDPAVLKVIGSAQRYLRTLLDDCSAGFDGYQQLAADDGNAAAVVDPQVQAIWAALQHELPLNYINPPPSYTSRSQRLRNPSEVFRGQAATCIDLALLFASCLEFVGIYPVLFLIEGHAFPGYWRSDKAWWRMKQFQFGSAPATAAAPGAPGTTAGPAPGPMASGQSESWMFDGSNNLGELMRYVQEGSLVPFESTFVATQRGFYAALEEGAARLHPDTFDAMVDVQSARGANVTPLPLFDKFE